MADVLRELNLTLTAYSLAPCWDDEHALLRPVRRARRPAGADQGLQLVQTLERRLHEVNIEYAAKRESRRLGPMRLHLLPANTWQQWDRQRLARTGGTLEQYKHPCLIADTRFRETLAIEEELQLP